MATNYDNRKKLEFTSDHFYGQYRYVGPTNYDEKDVNYEYDHEYFTNCINAAEYDEAERYLNNFDFTHQDDIDWKEVRLDELHHAKQEYKYIMDNATEEDKAWVEFNNKRKGNLATLTQKGLDFSNFIETSDNIVAKQYRQYIDGLFGDCDDIVVSFPKEKRKLAGLNIFDWVLRDNPNNFDSFLKDNNWDVDYIKEYGGTVVRHSDGTAKVTINRNSPILQDFLHAVGKISASWWDSSNPLSAPIPTIDRMRVDGSIEPAIFNSIEYTSALGGLFEGRTSTGIQYAAELYKISNEAEKIEKRIYENGGIFERMTDAVYMPLTFEMSEQLYGRMDAGGTDAAGAKNTYNYTIDKIRNAVAVMTGREANTAIRVYSDEQYRDDNGTARNLTDSEKREFFSETLGTLDMDDLEVGYVFFGDGSVSLRCTIKGKEATSKNQGRNRLIFDIDSSDLTRGATDILKSSDAYYAAVEANRIIAYGSDYRDSFGNIHNYKDADLTQAIHRDRLIKGYGRQLVTEYINQYGEALDYPRRFDDQINAAIYTVNELYPDLIPTINGEKLTPQQAFELLMLHRGNFKPENAKEVRARLLNVPTARYIDALEEAINDIDKYFMKYVKQQQ